LDRGHHTPDNFSPVDWVVKERDDGSVTVYIGNLNLITGVYYAVGLTLRPGKTFLETEVKTFNSRELPTKYYFWTNAAVPITEGSRVFIARALAEPDVVSRPPALKRSQLYAIAFAGAGAALAVILIALRTFKGKRR
jgi:hypothetical protein